MQFQNFASATFALFCWSLFAEPSVAQEAKLPAGFEACEKSSGVQQTTSMSIQTFKSCSQASGAREYGFVYVEFEPPRQSVTFSEMRNADKNRYRQAFKSFFFPRTKSGSVRLKLSIVEDNAERVLDTIPLADFKFSNNGGLTIVDNSKNLNSTGYRFQIAETTKVKSEVNFIFSNEQASDITGRIDAARKILAKLGVVTAPASALVQQTMAPLTQLEGEISNQFDTKDELNKPVELTFAPNGISAVEFEYSLGPSEVEEGRLFVGLKRSVSAFTMPTAAPKVANGIVNFGLPGYLSSSTADITGSVLNGKRLDQFVAEKIGPITQGNLTSKSSVEFNNACLALQNALRNSELNLHSQDQVLALWALLVQNQNIRTADIRTSSCIADYTKTDGEFSKHGLRLPPVDVVLPDQYRNVVTRSDSAAQKADEEQVIGSNRGAEGDRIANRATTIGNSDEVTVVDCWGAPESDPTGVAKECPFRPVYAGQKFSSTGDAFVGQQKIERGGSLETYSGEFKIFNKSPIPNGYGVYTFAKTESGPSENIGKFDAQQLSGSGYISWQDGAFYKGEVSNGQPHGFGVLTLASGVERRGRFDRGLLRNTEVVELRTDGSRQFGRFNGTQFLAGSAIITSP